MRLFYRIVMLFLMLCIASCGRPEKPPEPDRVTVQLKWVHQAQFAGFYVAQEEGYYADENLEVSFLEGGPGIDLTTALTSGRADVAVVAPEDVLVGRSKGLPITAIAAIYRRSAVVFVTKADSGIIHPADFLGKTVAVLGRDGSIRDFELQFQALMRRLRVDPTGVALVPYEPDYTKFYADTVDVTAAYITGGVIKMRQAGHRVHFLWPGDYGIRFYSDVLAATDRILIQRPDVMLRFLRATLKGWRDAIGKIDTAVDATLRYARTPDPDLQEAMMTALVPLVHTGEDHVGWMEESVWRDMLDILHDEGILVSALPALEACFTMRFLNAVYEEEGR